MMHSYKKNITALFIGFIELIGLIACVSLSTALPNDTTGTIPVDADTIISLALNTTPQSLKSFDWDCNNTITAKLCKTRLKNITQFISCLQDIDKKNVYSCFTTNNIATDFVFHSPFLDLVGANVIHRKATLPVEKILNYHFQSHFSTDHPLFAFIQQLNSSTDGTALNGFIHLNPPGYMSSPFPQNRHAIQQHNLGKFGSILTSDICVISNGSSFNAHPVAETYYTVDDACLTSFQPFITDKKIHAPLVDEFGVYIRGKCDEQNISTSKPVPSIKDDVLHTFLSRTNFQQEFRRALAEVPRGKYSFWDELGHYATHVDTFSTLAHDRRYISGELPLANHISYQTTTYNYKNGITLYYTTVSYLDDKRYKPVAFFATLKHNNVLTLIGHDIFAVDWATIHVEDENRNKKNFIYLNFGTIYNLYNDNEEALEFSQLTPLYVDHHSHLLYFAKILPEGEPYLALYAYNLNTKKISIIMEDYSYPCGSC